LDILRAGAYGRIFLDCWVLFADLISEVRLGALLRYGVRAGTLMRKGVGEHARYALIRPPEKSLVAQKKIEKSRQPWDGCWTVLTYDIPRTRNTARRRLARLLHVAGFAPLNASSWVSPYDWLEVLADAIRDELSEGAFSYIRAAQITALGHPSSSFPKALWELDKIRASYVHLAARCSAGTGKRGERNWPDLLRTAIWAFRELERIEQEDPMLPPQLLPARWPRRTALASVAQLRAEVRSMAVAPARRRETDVPRGTLD